jgi:hypothetical protein
MRKEIKIYKSSVEKNLDNINSIIKKIGVIAFSMKTKEGFKK